MWLSLCLCKNHSRFICVTSPASKNLICQRYKLFCIISCQTNDRHRPFHNSGLYVFIPCKSNFCLNRSHLHRKCIASSLKMFMCKNRATYNREICIRPHEIMWKLSYKIQKLRKTVPVDFHWYMIFMKANAMFVIIYIWRIL